MRARIFLRPGRFDGSSLHNRSVVSVMMAVLMAATFRNDSKKR